MVARKANLNMRTSMRQALM
ncbi:peptidase T, partial [Vibrio parahaemolyticus V-223/04]